MKTSQLLTLAVTAFGLTTGALAQGNNGRGRGGNNNTNKGGNGGGAAATTTAAAAAAATTTTAAAAGGNSAGGNTGSNNAGGNGGANSLLLLQSNVQAASDFIGNPAAGQANSDTDPANFINFCTGKTTTNGTQNTAGSCNGVVMGDIPSNNNMVSAIVLFPGPGDDLTPNQPFNISVQLANLIAGSFTDPLTTYYAAPQQLEGGNIVGHCHVTVQDLGNNLAPTQPPDPKVFAFFKGIDNDGNGQGLVQATVTAGLPAGFYRVCTLNSASNHQPVLMPVAQRGGQDDCQKFTVGQGSGNAGGNASDNAGSAADASSTVSAASSTDTAAAGNAGSNGQGGNNAGAGSGAAATTSAAASAQTTTAGGSNSSGRGGGNNNNGGKSGGGRGRFGRGRGRFAARDLIA